eukprot:4273147-Prymnesium_polylepis.1
MHRAVASIVHASPDACAHLCSRDADCGGLLFCFDGSCSCPIMYGADDCKHTDGARCIGPDATAQHQLVLNCGGHLGRFTQLRAGGRVSSRLQPPHFSYATDPTRKPLGREIAPAPSVLQARAGVLVQRGNLSGQHYRVSRGEPSIDLVWLLADDRVGILLGIGVGRTRRSVDTICHPARLEPAVEKGPQWMLGALVHHDCAAHFSVGVHQG